MTDRIINSAWWISVMGLICVVGVAGMYLVYRSLFDVLAGRWMAAMIGVTVGVGCAVGTVALCRHRDELVRF